MSRFASELRLELLRAASGKPLKSRGGRQLYRVLEPLVYQSDIAGAVSVPAGFVTDLGSVPRLPVVYWLFGDAFQWAAVVHDYLYSAASGPVGTRKLADAVLLEACRLLAEPGWRCRCVWLAVRVFGGGSFESRDVTPRAA